MTLHDLPKVNASLNGLSAIFLGFGFYFIRRKNIRAHQRCMLAALTASVLFLACYLTYHIGVHTITYFRKPLWFRPYYLVLLTTHTILAIVIVPLILMTVSRALRKRFELHRRIARWTWPIWMYVSVTGVLVYYILYVQFPQTP